MPNEGLYPVSYSRMLSSSSERSFATVLLFELFDLLNVVDEVIDLIKNWDGLCGDNISEIFLNLHSELYWIEPVESMIF